MLRFLLLISLCTFNVHGYFTLPGKCPTNVPLLESFKFEDFLGQWHQAYHYSSDGQEKSNCSKLELTTKHGDMFLNMSRVDRGLFHRYSVANVLPPRSTTAKSQWRLQFTYENAPRRLKTREYELFILATNYNYYATAYTCQYSPLIDKHFIYVWLLSRSPILNDVSKELALRPLERLGLQQISLIKDDLSRCTPKYYEDVRTEPQIFRYPVPI